MGILMDENNQISSFLCEPYTFLYNNRIDIKYDIVLVLQGEVNMPQFEESAETLTIILSIFL